MLKRKTYNIMILISILLSVSIIYFTASLHASADITIPKASADAEDYGYGYYPYEWIDVSNNRVEIPLDIFTSLPMFLPFTFPFYNESYNYVFISQYGYMSFLDPTPVDSTEESIPCSTPTNWRIIAPYWDGLVYGANTHIYVANDTNRFVIDYINIERLGDVYTFQCVLYSNGDILFQYEELENVYTHTIGICYNGSIGQEAPDLLDNDMEIAYKFRKTLQDNPTFYRTDDNRLELNQTDQYFTGLIIDDNFGGSADYEIFLDDIGQGVNPWDPYTNLLQVLDDFVDDLPGDIGNHNLTVKFDDNANNGLQQQTYIINIDNRAPLIQVMYSPGIDYEEGDTIDLPPNIMDSTAIVWFVTDYYHDDLMDYSFYYESILNGYSVDANPVGYNVTNNTVWTSRYVNTTVYNGNFTDGPHSFNLQVNDGLGGISSFEVIVNQIWNYPPVLSQPSAVSYNVNSTGNTVDVYVHDYNNTLSRMYYINFDGGATEQSGSWENLDYITFSIDGLSVGTHVCEVTVADGRPAFQNNNAAGGLTTSVNFTITVKNSFLQDHPDFEEPDDSLPTKPKNTGWPIEYWIYIGVGAGGAAAIAAGVLLYRKKQDSAF